MPAVSAESSRTRLAPVFDLLQRRGDDWVRTLLTINEAPDKPPPDLSGLNLQFEKGYWGKNEHSLDPPVALLSWLIRNPGSHLSAQDNLKERRSLAGGDPVTVGRALHALRTSAAPKGWHLLESPTLPDVMIETPDALIVMETPRSDGGTTPESGPGERQRIWRHIDAAWEIRGRRRVFGFFIVVSEEPAGRMPVEWRNFFREMESGRTLDANFPHRSSAERDALAACMLGGTTGQNLCTEFGISSAALPRTIHDPTNAT